MTDSTIVKGKRQSVRARINGSRGPLAFRGGDPDKVYRVVNDVDDRVALFKEMGWTVVDNDKVTVGERKVTTDSKLGSVVSHSVGGGVKGVLMEIPKELFEEDQKAKLREIDEDEAGIRGQSSQDGNYGKVEISRR